MYVVFNQVKFGTSTTANKLSQQDVGDHDLKSQSGNYSEFQKSAC